MMLDRHGHTVAGAALNHEHFPPTPDQHSVQMSSDLSVFAYSF